jgi:uncharacterized membrane protein
MLGPSREPSLTVVLRTGILVFFEGLSVGLCGWALRMGEKLAPYAAENRLSRIGRGYLLADMFGTAAIFLLAAAVYLLVRRRTGGLEKLHRLAVRLSPLVVTGLLPFLMRWPLWIDRDLTFLVLAAMAGLGFRHFLGRSLSAEPVLAHTWAGNVVDVARARVAVALRRLERSFPLALVGLGAIGYGLYFSFYTIRNHHNLQTASLDLGLEDNLLWNLVHGGPFLKTSPPFGPVGSHFGYHATFFSYVLGLFYALVPRPETLLVLQAFLIGAAAVPLFLFARRKLGPWPALLVAFLYLFYPPVHGSNLYDFHYLPLGPFFLWLTLYLVDARHFRWAILAVVLTLSVREDVAAGLAIVGAYLMFTGERPRAGLVVTCVAGAYFLVLKMIAMPHALQGGSSFINQYAGLLPEGEHGYGGVLKTVIANPIFTLQSLLERDKLIYLLQIMVPLCFFPWSSSLGLLCSLPGFFFTLLATGYPPLIQTSFQYTAHWTAFVFLALVANLQQVGRPRFPDDRNGAARQRSWLAAMALTMLLASLQYGAVLQQHTVRGGFGPFRFTSTELDRSRRADLEALIALVPPRAKIVSSENIVPHVSGRPDSYTLRIALFDAEYMLFSLPARGDEAVHLLEGFDGGAFGVIAERGEFVLARRGAPRDKNGSVLSRLR